MSADEKLYRQFMEGNEAGLTELLERHGHSLTMFINCYVADLQDAEDLMLEAFSRVVNRRPALEENGFKAYLYKTARNLALRYVERKHRQPFFGIEDLGTEPADQHLIEEILNRRERNAILYRSMEKLSPDYREALYLIYFEDMSYVQAAVVMKKSVKQIDNLVQRGKKALRVILEKEGISDF